MVPGHSGIPGNEEADCQANLAREAKGSTTIERPYTSASNRARRISEGRSAAKAQWEADKCSKHFGYRLKGKAGNRRPIPMASAKPLATRFYQLKCGHAPTGAYLKRFGHREDDKCWWCGGTVAQTRGISSGTAAGGNTSSGSSGRRWERQRAGKLADAGGHRCRSCFPWRYVTRR